METEPTNPQLEAIRQLQGLEPESLVSYPDSIDSQAREEKSFFGRDEQRKEEAKEVLHKAFIWFIRTAAFIFIILFIVRMLHFILPQRLCWLEEPRIQAIDKFLFSGAMGGLVMNYIKQSFPQSQSKSDD